MNDCMDILTKYFYIPEEQNIDPDKLTLRERLSLCLLYPCNFAIMSDYFKTPGFQIDLNPFENKIHAELREASKRAIHGYTVNHFKPVSPLEWVSWNEVDTTTRISPIQQLKSRRCEWIVYPRQSLMTLINGLLSQTHEAVCDVCYLSVMKNLRVESLEAKYYLHSVFTCNIDGVSSLAMPSFREKASFVGFRLPGVNISNVDVIRYQIIHALKQLWIEAINEVYTLQGDY